jgi:transcription-repair coupling factor (superfamily II helicase)
MKERIREIAGELIATAALRALRAPPMSPGDSAYNAFVDRFPYEETDDQDRAIGDTLDDLAAGKPMDRLVVGDVGFGKTEVALRAAFVAAMAGMQVAVVCPTTLLARQHYTNFVERMRGFPIEIGRLSRLVPAAEAKRPRRGWPTARSISSSARMPSSPRASSSSGSASSSSTRSSASASRTRSGSRRSRPTSTS